jgi:hypothetical protein
VRESSFHHSTTEGPPHPSEMPTDRAELESPRRVVTQGAQRQPLHPVKGPLAEPQSDARQSPASTRRHLRRWHLQCDRNALAAVD